MSKINDIINGYANKTLADLSLFSEKEKIRKDTFAQERMAVCKSCDIFESSSTICSSDKGGCGCTMSVKIYCTNCSCPKKKW